MNFVRAGGVATMVGLLASSSSWMPQAHGAMMLSDFPLWPDQASTVAPGASTR